MQDGFTSFYMTIGYIDKYIGLHVNIKFIYILLLKKNDSNNILKMNKKMIFFCIFLFT